jgi:hypothetical protein
MPAPDPWADARRIESWAGEVRVNLIRLAALVAFYGYHLLNVYVLHDDPTAAGRFHEAVTALVLAWVVGCLALYFCLSRRWVPPALKYAGVLWDVLLITLLLALAGTPQSPLAVLYFLVIASAPLRLSLRLVYVATGASLLAYLLSLGYYAYFVVGYNTYYSNPAVRIPRTHEIIFLLALAVAGFLAGQSVRQVHRLVQGPPIAVKEAQE